MHGEALGCWKVRASGLKLQFSCVVPENHQCQKRTDNTFVLNAHLELFLMGGSLPRLGIHSFLQIIESDSKDRDQAGRESMGFKLTESRPTNQV